MTSGFDHPNAPGPHKGPPDHRARPSFPPHVSQPRVASAGRQQNSQAGSPDPQLCIHSELTSPPCDRSHPILNLIALDIRSARTSSQSSPKSPR